MVPGKYHCPPRWTREYFGYLMSERHNHYRSTFECVDMAPEEAPVGEGEEDGNENGALFFSRGATTWESALPSLPR